MASASKDYAAIARANIRKPSQSERGPRVLVYGRNKKGKTRFCTSVGVGKILIIDPEDGTKHETKIDPDVWPVTSWDDINDIYMFLKTGKHSYEWVALDGLTRITNMALRWVMNQEEERNLERKPNQVGKQDYGKSGEMVKGMLHNFDSLRSMGLIITTQERMREVEASGEEDDDVGAVSHVFVPDLPAGVRSSVNSIVDVIARIYTVRGEFPRQFKKRGSDEVITKMVEGVHRRLWLGNHNSYDTGYRSEYVLPDFISEPTLPKLIQLMKEGKV
jgi:hypothetical protein